MRLYDYTSAFYNLLLNHNNTLITIPIKTQNGDIREIKCKLSVDLTEGIYPYRATWIHASLTIVNKFDDEYVTIKEKLRDDWSFDLFGSDEDMLCRVIERLEKRKSVRED